jgi:hypothetical protein
MLAMRSFLLKLVLLMLGMAAPPLLYADLWKCEKSGESPLFTSDRNEAKKLGCTQITVTPNVVSSPPAGKSSSSPTPGGFPKVAPQVQQQRDNDRKKILENELVNEEKNLQAAKRELAEQENTRLGSERNYQRVLDRIEPYQKKVKLHEDNIANLKRELANIR